MTKKLSLAKTSSGLSHVNHVRPRYETREIVIAMGKEFHNGDPGMKWSMPEILKDPGSRKVRDPDVKRWWPNLAKLKALKLQNHTGGGFEYVNSKQGVKYILKVVTDKKDFVTALNTPKLLVIYDGHARYGRGPCFGSGGHSPGEAWEEGTGSHPNSDGLFRMGYPYISVPVKEIIDHGYTANLVKSSVKLTRTDCDPDLRRHLTHMKKKTLNAIKSTLSGTVLNPDLTAKYWTYGNSKPHVVLHAGWKNTLSTPDDLDAHNPKCRVFCHFGCSTFSHNWRVIRKRKKWTRSGNDHYAYFVKGLSDAVVSHYWLYFLLSYQKFNAFKQWKEVLRYAVARTNTMLRKDRAGYSLI